MTERKSSTRQSIAKSLKPSRYNESGQGPGGGHIIKVIQGLLNALHQVGVGNEKAARRDLIKAEHELTKILQKLPK